MAPFILQALYYFLPAYFANMAPVIFSKLNPLKHPVDFNKTLNKKPVFGKNKTWGGLIYAIIIGTLIFYFQIKLYNYEFFRNISLINYSQQPLFLGFLLASGAILGDLAKSFIKRRLNKAPGQQWFPFDQLDYVIGAFFFSFFIHIPDIKIILTIIILAPFLHYLVNYIGYKLKLKSVKW